MTNFNEPINTTIRIFVSNLGAYNSGVLTGEWWTLPVKDTKEIYKQDCEEFGSVEGYGEEYFISDYEACFHIDEYDNIELLNKLANSLKNNSLKSLDEVYYSLNEHRREQVGLDEPLEFTEENVNYLTRFMDHNEVARAVFFGNVQNWRDDYIRLDGYENLESLSRWQWNEELYDNADEIIKAYEQQNNINL